MSSADPALAPVDTSAPERTRTRGRRPLTLAQQGVWFAQRRDPAATVYRCLEQVDLSGPVDRDRLSQAIAAAQAGFPQLGAVFGEDSDGEPYQLIPDCPQSVVEVEYADVSTAPDPASAALAIA
ncbi:MAG: condensation domain-containing protein, partial [Propionibacteriaceae bacterium]|nr:condensation domain-containing protein [Propionibacteriaceae bacterium]